MSRFDGNGYTAAPPTIDYPAELAQREPAFDPAIAEWIDRAMLDLLGRAAAVEEKAIAADLRRRALTRYEIDERFRKRVDLVVRLLKADRLVDAFDPKWLVVVALGSDELIRAELDELRTPRTDSIS